MSYTESYQLRNKRACNYRNWQIEKNRWKKRAAQINIRPIQAMKETRLTPNSCTYHSCVLYAVQDEKKNERAKEWRRQIEVASPITSKTMNYFNINYSKLFFWWLFACSKVYLQAKTWSYKRVKRWRKDGNRVRKKSTARQSQQQAMNICFMDTNQQRDDLKEAHNRSWTTKRLTKLSKSGKGENKN